MPLRHDGVDVQLAHADEKVAVEPELDAGAQPGHVDPGWWSGHFHDDVDQGVDVAGAHGDDHVLELALALAGHPADVAEVEDGKVAAVGEQEVPRVWVGVVEAVAKDHLQVDLGRPMNEGVDVPARRLDAGPVENG